MKYGVFAFAGMMLLCDGCKDDGPETPPERTYTKEWVLDINEYLGLDADAGRTYEAVVIDELRMLVSHNTGTTGSLVEINYSDGTFIRQTSTDRDSLRLIKSGYAALVVHEQTDTKAYTVGNYNPDSKNPLDFFPTLQRGALSPENGQLMGLAAGPPETIYTYGSMPGKNGPTTLWIANWYLDGSHRWTTVIDHHLGNPLDAPTFDAQVVTDRNLIFSAETEDNGYRRVLLMSVNSHSGYFDVLTGPSVNVPILHMVENFATGFMYVFYDKGYSKLDLYGDATFYNPQEFATGTLTTRPLVIYTSKMFLAVHDGDDITLVSASDKEIQWTEKYWERSTLPLTLLSAQKMDGVMVVSSNGFVTKYRENK